MREIKVYKKIRLQAVILGLPAKTFWVMIIFDCMLFMILTTGFSLAKLIVVVVGLVFTYVIAKMSEKKDLFNSIKTNDYKRNNA